jgi:hypothetical protein
VATIYRLPPGEDDMDQIQSIYVPGYGIITGLWLIPDDCRDLKFAVEALY